jgi:hypothetical protein
MQYKKLFRISGLLVFIIACGVALWQRQAILDWWHLRGYMAPSSVAQLASDDTMTPYAQRLFYVNHPTITTGTGFSSHCPSGGEKTIVLGCYLGADDGIYLYNVTDVRLHGVEQVTAAHETLHAAYRRLSDTERQQVDSWLTNYYEHDLTDQRIKDTIAAYKKSEPNDVVNEMHSVFGTEVPNLPTQLEDYYKRYFTDRSTITNYAAQYQNEFTSRQAQITAYDAQLKALKPQIDANEASLNEQKTSLDDQSKQLQSERSSGQIAAYNAGVPEYNAAVNSYNALVSTRKELITQYNAIVDQRNAIALEEEQLAKALSSDAVPAQ